MVISETMKSSRDVKLGNLIGYVLFPFTIALREDALDYVRSAKATGKRKKATLEATYTYFMAKTFNKFFGAKPLFEGTTSVNVMLCNTSMVFTSEVGFVPIRDGCPYAKAKFVVHDCWFDDAHDSLCPG
ncbi:O-acyltransferase WSD [Salix suchowensis]|nr:O-acyltransferase WSD [Salix suchowensis]